MLLDISFFGPLKSTNLHCAILDECRVGVDPTQNVHKELPTHQNVDSDHQMAENYQVGDNLYLSHPSKY